MAGARLQWAAKGEAIARRLDRRSVARTEAAAERDREERRTRAALRHDAAGRLAAGEAERQQARDARLAAESAAAAALLAHTATLHAEAATRALATARAQSADTRQQRLAEQAAFRLQRVQAALAEVHIVMSLT